MSWMRICTSCTPSEPQITRETHIGPAVFGRSIVVIRLTSDGHPAPFDSGQIAGNSVENHLSVRIMRVKDSWW